MDSVDSLRCKVLEDAIDATKVQPEKANGRML